MAKFSDLHDSVKSNTIIDSDIDSYLEEKDFSRDTCVYGGNIQGWVNGYYSKCRTYYYRVHITASLIRIHQEYECGGLISDWDFSVTPDDCSSIDSFVKLLDKAYDVMDI